MMDWDGFDLMLKVVVSWQPPRLLVVFSLSRPYQFGWEVSLLTCWRHDIVSLVPDPVVELRHLGADHGEAHPLAQGGLGVAFYLQGNGIKENLDIADIANLISGCEIQK